MTTTNDPTESQLETWLHEYDKLASESVARIGFRDNLIYATLAAYGAIASFAATDASHYAALWVLPWASIVLGWTYLINDDKISAIGRYLRDHASKQIAPLVGLSDSRLVFGWEVAHRSDHRRKRRKLFQLIIDQLTFVASGIAALVACWILVGITNWATGVLFAIESLLLLVLGIEIVVYADLKKDAALPKPDQNLP